MDLQTLPCFFLCCFLINLAILLFWSLLMVLARDWVYRVHSKWSQISPEHFNAIHYAGIAMYKISIFMFFLVPYLTLRMV